MYYRHGVDNLLIANKKSRIYAMLMSGSFVGLQCIYDVQSSQ